MEREDICTVTGSRFYYHPGGPQLSFQGVLVIISGGPSYHFRGSSIIISGGIVIISGGVLVIISGGPSYHFRGS